MAPHRDDRESPFKRVDRRVNPRFTPEQEAVLADYVRKLAGEMGFEALSAEFEARVTKTEPQQTVLPGSLLADRYVRFHKKFARIEFKSKEAPLIVFKEMLYLKNVEIQKLLNYDHVGQTLYNIRQRNAMQ